MHPVLALRIPADPRLPCELLALHASAAALSDVIGGGMLDDVLVVDIQGRRCCLYADAGRHAKDLPVNERALALVRVLADTPGSTLEPPPAGAGDSRPLDGACGDVLVTGLDAADNDADLPGILLLRIRDAGLLPGTPAPPLAGEPR